MVFYPLVSMKCYIVWVSTYFWIHLAKRLKTVWSVCVDIHPHLVVPAAQTELSTHAYARRTVLLTNTVLWPWIKSESNICHFELPSTEGGNSFKIPHKKVSNLQVCYVPIDVHGGGEAVFRDVFVAIWIRFTVDRVDTGDGNSLLPKSYVPVNTTDADYRSLSKSRRQRFWQKFSKIPGSKLQFFAIR